MIQPDGTVKGPTKEERQAVVALLDVMSKTRFQPARYAGSPAPVAVNMVWLYASLTVKAKMPDSRSSGGRSRSGSTLLRDVVSLSSRLIYAFPGVSARAVVTLFIASIARMTMPAGPPSTEISKRSRRESQIPSVGAAGRHGPDSIE